MKRDVSSRIVLNVTAPADLVFSVAVSSLYAPTSENLTVTVDGEAVPVTELPDTVGGRLHRVAAPVGELVLEYTASIEGQGEEATSEDTELLVYGRPSRYAESDTLAPTAHAEFDATESAPELLKNVASWVGTQLSYVPGSSLPTDGAVRTILARQGVCRDYSHVGVALLRALGVPARLVSVYAPGLSPMDFHAVAEAWLDGKWHVIDATTLAPRSSLVRIATGRDAADTAFLNVLAGRADLIESTVTAVVDELPQDDLNQLAEIR